MSSNDEDAIHLNDTPHHNTIAAKVSQSDKHKLQHQQLKPSQVKKCKIDVDNDDGIVYSDEKALNVYSGFSLLPSTVSTTRGKGCPSGTGTAAVKVDDEIGAFISTENKNNVIPTYVLDNTRTNIPRILWNDCISQRKPCVIDALPEELCDNRICNDDNANEKPLPLDMEVLVRVAGQELVQVERRLDAKEAFGQVRCTSRQCNMSVHDFCQALLGAKGDHSSDGHLLYLSTQEMDDDDNNNGNSTATAPCKQLLDNKIIPETLSWAGNLIRQSCNLWMGASATTPGINSARAHDDDKVGSTSSGLHHDFHDNFYILLHGRKSFRLFSPDCALHMKTYGKIHRIHPNGLISYVGSETLPNGLPLDDDQEDSDGEGLLFGIGNGFDRSTESDMDSDNDDNDNTSFPMTDGARDDFDEICGGPADDDSEQKPNNFSRIDLRGRSLEELKRDFDSFAEVHETVVHLKAGQSLYLPAGWFHEVTSKSSKGQYHMALNYWYHPPDNLDDFNCPYSDKERFTKNT